MKLGLSNGTSAGGRIVSIVAGTFRVKVPEGTEGAITRENKEGKVVTELTFSELTGYIKNITTEESKYGKQIKFSIQADKEYTLAMGYADGLTSSILKMLPNVDPTKPVTIRITKKMDDVKKKELTSIFLSQEDAPVKWAYTKAEPNGLPPFEKIIVKGKEQWDNTTQIDFLWKESAEKFVAKLGNEKKDDGFQDFEISEEVEF